MPIRSPDRDVIRCVDMSITQPRKREDPGNEVGRLHCSKEENSAWISTLLRRELSGLLDQKAERFLRSKK